jgi:pyruvate formate lyase activating enzyme
LYCHNPDTWKTNNGLPVTLAHATEELAKYRHGLKVMSGGFTLSGGEPLLQDRFAARLFAAAHGMGIHTALDTNGALGSRLSDGEWNIDVCWISKPGIGAPFETDGHGGGPPLDFAPAVVRRGGCGCASSWCQA